jgi:hypothetical protein
MTRDDLISAIEAFATAWGIAPATVTSRGVQNSRLYARLKSGGGCNLIIAEKLRAYMAANPAPTPETPDEDAA